MLGYHGIFLSDHVAITPSVASRYTEPFFDALTTLAFLARQTANLDALSGGQLIFGVGIGNAVDKFAALGVPHHWHGA